ncbi:hypothetical protein [Paenibacillus sp.]|jgi:hypothetical protein|uniref:hypothetical protein n=1 Tax=Paenibacillus sp. TaxID=58172 RepID=UPI002816BA71|nr:hypothetical protein [Paenibacillus sp.]MDR0270995.1 hypothetical protein [Paenibacillus sp.]
MIKEFYIQLDSKGILRDCTVFKTEGYILAELEFPLPGDIICGYYKYVDGKLVLDQELKTKSEEEQRRYDKEEFDNLKREVEELKNKIAEITG